MKIGADCFVDGEWKAIIKGTNRIGKCDISLKDNCHIYDTEKDYYLEESFSDILDLFCMAEDLASDKEIKTALLCDFLEDWNIFCVPKSDIQKIIMAICQSRYKAEPDLFEKKVAVAELVDTDFSQGKFILKNNDWDEFCNDLKHKNRFHPEGINLESLKPLIESRVLDIHKGNLRLYRSRICNDSHYDRPFECEEMGAPPPELTKSGRTNAKGISCLYLSGDKETTYHEARARNYDHLSVGEFVQVADLKIVDLTQFDKISIALSKDYSWFANNIDVIRKIGAEISKPLRSFDDPVDYIPTQYICDYIKYLGYDGIKFNSTLHKNGINYTIFDESKFKCVAVSMVKIAGIEFKF